MHTIAIDPSSRTVYTAYALAHGAEHDDSYTGAEDGRYDATPGHAHSRLSDPRVVPEGALIAWRDRVPVGVVLTVREEADDGRSIAGIETLAVVPEEQGRGIGGALLGMAVARSQAAGFAEIELSTGATNARALSLYGSHGFEIVDVRVCFSLRKAAGGAWPAMQVLAH